MIKPVLIIGSGLAGLSLAQGLKNNNIPFRIYERDDASSSRAQGYRIRINKDGQEGLKALLTPAVWKIFEDGCASNEAQGMMGVDARTGEKVQRRPRPGQGGPAGPGSAGGPGGPRGTGGSGGSIAGRPGGGPPPLSESLPADRRVMRSILMTDLSESITYSKSFASYSLTLDGIVVHFADGTTSVEGSLLIGVDGRGSRVAQQYLGDLCAPIDTLTRMIYGKTPLTPSLESKLPQFVKGGIALAFDNVEIGTRTLFTECMRFSYPDSPEDYIYWVMLGDHTALEVDDDAILLKSQGDKAANIAKNVASGWADGLQVILDEQDEAETAVLKMTTANPFDFPTWTPSERITLLGDAIHPMPPAGGQGANTALRNAAILCNLLVKHQDDAEREGKWKKEVIGEYENDMRSYASQIIGGSHDAATRVFGVKPLDRQKLSATTHEV